MRGRESKGAGTEREGGNEGGANKPEGLGGENLPRKGKKVINWEKKIEGWGLVHGHRHSACRGS